MLCGMGAECKEETWTISQGHVEDFVSVEVRGDGTFNLSGENAAIAGKSCSPRQTPPDSTTTPTPRGKLEDQRSAAQVTKDGGSVGDVQTTTVDDKSLWGNNLGS